MAELLMGIDIGTYSSKGVLCAPDGQVLAVSEVEHGLSLPRPGWAEHDADEIWWGDCVRICRGLLSSAGRSGRDVAALAVSGIGPDLLPVDELGRPLRPGILYGIDTRATQEIEWLQERFGTDKLYEHSGMHLTSQAVGPKLLWLRRNEPEVFARTRYLMSCSSYLVYKLTGEYVLDYHTASHYNPLFDPRKLEWSGEFAEPICDLSLLPRLEWANSVVGKVHRRAAEETGLLEGTPVTAGTIDAVAEAVSVGVVHPGDLMLMYGTTLFFILVQESFVPNPKMWVTTYAFPGTYALAGGMSTTGAITRWARDQLARELVEREESGGERAYSVLSREAEQSPPGARGLLLLPYFQGERTPIHDPQARGVLAGLTLAHTRGDIYRAIMEGTAYGVRHNLETMRQTGAEPSRLVAVGGGTKSPLWLQVVSDVTGLPQEVPELTIGASYGDAFLAGIAVGLVPTLDALRSTWVRGTRVVTPDLEKAAIYERGYQLYLQLYERTRDLVHALGKLAEGK